VIWVCHVLYDPSLNWNGEGFVADDKTDSAAASCKRVLI
jgi:hypothetical protein